MIQSEEAVGQHRLEFISTSSILVEVTGIKTENVHCGKPEDSAVTMEGKFNLAKAPCIKPLGYIKN